MTYHLSILLSKFIAALESSGLRLVLGWIDVQTDVNTVFVNTRHRHTFSTKSLYLLSFI